MVSINEKSKLIKIIQKEQLTEEDKEELRHILSKLPSEELKSLLGKKYELFIKNLWSEAMPLVRKFSSKFDWSSVGKLVKKNGKLDIKAYARIVKSAYAKEILEERRKRGFGLVQYRFDKQGNWVGTIDPIKAEEVKNIEELASAKGRSKLFWYGIVYEITYRSTGRSIGGYTTGSLRKRWSDYVIDTISRGRLYGLHRVIWSHLENHPKGLSFFFDQDGKPLYGRIFKVLDKSFNRKVKRICFDINSLKTAEIDFIKDNNLISDGYNTRRGGQGQPEYDINMMEVAFYLCLGYNVKEITRELQIRHKDFAYISNEVVKSRIQSYWGSFSEAQIKFLRPMFMMLIISQFELYEINEALNDRYMLNRIEALFPGYTYQTLLNLGFDDWFDIPIPKTLPSWSYAGRTKAKISVDTLNRVLLKYIHYTSLFLDKNIKEFLSNYNAKAFNSKINIVNYQVKNQLGYDTFLTARETMEPVHLIKQIRLLNPESDTFIADLDKIIRDMGYRVASLERQRLSLPKKLFHGMDLREVCRFLKKYPSIQTKEDFDAIFYSEKGRLKKTITKALIDKYAAESVSRSTSFIVKEGYDRNPFDEELHRHYKSWDDAKRQVKSRILIEKLKQLDPSDDSFNQILTKFFHEKLGYSKSVGKIHERCRHLLNVGKEVDAQMIWYFLNSNPWINTYEQFKVEFNKRNLVM